MPDLLTRRNGTWHFVRRVPVALTHADPRGIIEHSTKIRIADDWNGRRAAEVAARLNEQLELTWKGLLADRVVIVLMHRRDDDRIEVMPLFVARFDGADF